MVLDHLNNEYISIKSMCEKYGITVAMLNGRLKRGWTLEEALTKPKFFIKGESSHVKCTDFLGNKFDSITQMCKAYNISPHTYRFRINSGWTQKDALTKKVKLGNNQFS